MYCNSARPWCRSWTLERLFQKGCLKADKNVCPTQKQRARGADILVCQLRNTP
jgi:hypothetical protein